MANPDGAADVTESSARDHAVFIDSSLDTHMAMVVDEVGTVSDLKKKIQCQHALCFPDIGEININSLQVKRRGLLYHLSDSMSIRTVFDGVKSSWFVYVDLCRMVKHDMEIELEHMGDDHFRTSSSDSNIFADDNNESSEDDESVVSVLSAGTKLDDPFVSDVSEMEDDTGFTTPRTVGQRKAAEAENDSSMNKYTLEMLRESARLEKAKRSKDSESQLDEFVPDSQADQNP
ncbi:unnamed protein product [Rhodiola kirilowii]